MSTEYKHIKQYSQTPFTLECEVCQQVYPPLSVRSHLRTKKHQKNAIDLKKNLEELAYKSIYETSRTSKSTLHE